MSESILNLRSDSATLVDDDVRHTFISRAAELYDRPVDIDLGELDGYEDTPALLLAFPWMTDAELLEALWALGEIRAGTDF